MILTNKTKKDFFNHYYRGIKWTHEDVELFCWEEDIVQYALITKWLDSVGIYVGVETECVFTDNENNGAVFYSYVNESNLNHTFYTRQEAIKQAIIKANEIYNRH